MLHDAEIFGHGIDITREMADRLRELAYGLADLGDKPNDIADAVAVAMAWPRNLVDVDDIEVCQESGDGLIAVHVFSKKQ